MSGSDPEDYTIGLGWALKATPIEIGATHVRMAAVSAGDGNPGWEGEAFENAVKFYGTSVIAHVLVLLRDRGMKHNDIMAEVFRELRSLEDNA